MIVTRVTPCNACRVTASSAMITGLNRKCNAVTSFTPVFHESVFSRHSPARAGAFVENTERPHSSSPTDVLWRYGVTRPSFARSLRIHHILWCCINVTLPRGGVGPGPTTRGGRDPPACVPRSAPHAASINSMQVGVHYVRVLGTHVIALTRQRHDRDVSTHSLDVTPIRGSAESITCFPGCRRVLFQFGPDESP